MLNVCYLIDAPFLGGAEYYISKIATRLDRTRFNPSVIMRQPDHSGSGLVKWRADLESGGVPVRAIPMDLPFRPYRIGAVVRAIAGLSPHVVHVNLPGPQDGQMGLLVPISRMAGARGVMVTEHLPMVESTWKRSLLKKISYRWVDTVATVCHANVRYLVAKQHVRPGNVRVIHNALDVSFGTRVEDNPAGLRAEFGLPEESVLIAQIGNLFEHKGIHRTLRALIEMPELPWHLVVVGEGPEREPGERTVARHGLGDRVTFLGRLPGEKIERLLATVDVLTLPSTLEGMPYVILEAMASAVPVVATNVFGIPEMVAHGETGLLVEPGDRAGLSAAFGRLITNRDEREALGRSGRDRFERLFTLDRQIEKIETLYLETAGPGMCRRTSKGNPV